MDPKYDKWEDTDAALSAARKLIIRLHNETGDKAQIEAELKEVRKWCIEMHNRRIAINIRKPSA